MENNSDTNKVQYVQNVEVISNCNRLVALLLCLFFGYIGIHRFYVGKVGTGILMIFLGWTCIWWFIDFIMIITGSFKDKQGKPVKKW